MLIDRKLVLGSARGNSAHKRESENSNIFYLDFPHSGFARISKKISGILYPTIFIHTFGPKTHIFLGQTLESAQRAGGMTSISSHCQHHIVGTLSPHLLVQSVKLCNANQHSFRVVFRFLISTFCILQRTIFFT